MDQKVCLKHDLTRILPKSKVVASPSSSSSFFFFTRFNNNINKNEKAFIISTTTTPDCIITRNVHYENWCIGFNQRVLLDENNNNNNNNNYAINNCRMIALPSSSSSLDTEEERTRRQRCCSSSSSSKRRRTIATTTVFTMAAILLLLSSSSSSSSFKSLSFASAFITRNNGGGTSIARTPSSLINYNQRRRSCQQQQQSLLVSSSASSSSSRCCALKMATDSRELRFFAAAAAASASSSSASSSSQYTTTTTFASSASGRSISYSASSDGAAVGKKKKKEQQQQVNISCAATAAASSSSSVPSTTNMSFESIGIAASSSFAPSYFSSSSTRGNTNVSSSSSSSTEASVRHQTAMLFSSSKPLQATAEVTETSQEISSSTTTTTTTKKPFMQLRYHSTQSSFSSEEESSSSSSNKNKSSSPTIHLSPEEKKLFKLLVQVIQESPDITSTTQLRVAGGWVRDKLLATDEFRWRGGGGRRRDLLLCPPRDGEMMMKGGGGGGDGEVTRLTSKYKGSSSNVSLENTATGPSAGRHGTKVIGGAAPSTTTSPSPSSSNNPNQAVKTLSQATHQQPVDIDIALDDMLGKDFAEHLNHWLSNHGRQTHSVGVVLKNPEKSKHLETATMKVGQFWIDFVNLRAEEYTEDSRIPDLMRIGTPEEDAHRRDLTINALFYNINTGRVEDMTGRGFDDLKRGIVATPLPPLTTLLDDPLRVLRAVRFAARLRFGMDESLRTAAADGRVREALAQKVSRERVGSEVDLMLRSPDPVGAMRLITNLGLASTVFPLGCVVDRKVEEEFPIYEAGLRLLSTTHDHLCDCKANPPVWCKSKQNHDDDLISSSTTTTTTTFSCYGVSEIMLMDDEESRRALWYAAFLKPLRDYASKLGKDRGDNSPRRQGKKSSRSVITHMMVDQLKRPSRDSEATEKIMKAADDFTRLMMSSSTATSGFDSMMSTKILLSEIRVAHHYSDEEECELDVVSSKGDVQSYITCSMISAEDGFKMVDPVTEDDPMWLEAMEFRLLCSKVLQRVGPLWRAALILSLAEQLEEVNAVDMIEFAIEGDVIEESKEEVRQGIIAKYDAFAASLLELGLVGIWSEQPLLDGREMKQEGVLPNIPKGPVFREIMDEQTNWMITHPGGDKDALVRHLHEVFPEFV